MSVGLLVELSLSPDGQAKLFGQRVNHRDAHTVQTSRHLVGVIVELTARVQNRHNDLCRRDTLFVLLCRNATPIIANTHRFIGVNDNVDLATVPR